MLFVDRGTKERVTERRFLGGVKVTGTPDIGITGIILHTGVFSLKIEDETVEHQAFYPEAFKVPEATTHAANATHTRLGHVIAVGTTVVRALETAWTPNGLRACAGITSLYVHSGNALHVVNGLLTGLHEPQKVSAGH